jgi:hypothetical protein
MERGRRKSTVMRVGWEGDGHEQKPFHITQSSPPSIIVTLGADGVGLDMKKYSTGYSAGCLTIEPLAA